MQRLTLVSVAMLFLTLFLSACDPLGFVSSDATTLSAAQSRALLVSESFEAASSFPFGSWTNASGTGTWQIVTKGSKALYQAATGSGSYLATTSASSATDSTVSAKVWLSSSSIRGGVLGRFSSTGNYYSAYFYNGKIYLDRRKNSSTSTLASVAVSYNYTSWQTVSLQMSGSSIKVFVNGVQKISLTNSDLASGVAGVYTTKGPVWFDDFSVDSSAPQPTSSITPTPSQATPTPTVTTPTPTAVTPTPTVVTPTPVTPTPTMVTPTPTLVTPTPTGTHAGRTVLCTTTTQIQNALRYAMAGDRIVVRAGTYVASKGTDASGTSDAYYYSPADGTATQRIILEAEDPANPPTLSGVKLGDGYILWITGSYWDIRNMKFTNGKKGIMLDSSNYSTIKNVEVWNTAEEGIHLRDGSSYCVIEACNIHDIGMETPDYGEGVYIGSDKAKWDQFVRECDYNVVRNCVIGPNVRAESIDIKEGTTGTIVEYNIFRGAGISGANYADSFMDVKGENCIIRYNTAYQEGNSIIVNAFEVHLKEGNDGSLWGRGQDFHHNTVYMDSAMPYVVYVFSGCTARVSQNTRSPAGNMYIGAYTEY